MPIHRLSNVDLVNRTATCSICGPTAIVFIGSGRQCKNKQRATLKTYINRRTAEFKALSPPLPRQQREYGTQAHVLSEVDDENKTAVCLICGPVRIYVSKHPDGDYVTRRCSKANSQEVMAAARKRRAANRVFLDEYKVQCGCQRCGYNASAIGLDLHHRNPAEKDLEISKASSYSRERLEQELAKCDVLCAICHRLVHEELRYD